MKNFATYYPPNQKLYFSGSDKEELFQINQQTQPKDWIYRTKEIVYSYNEHGFREKCFKEIDWKNSVVMFGCSFVEGVGLAEEDTIARQLEKNMQTPVVNLGVGGSGIDVACWNSTTLHEYYPTPKAVVHLWSGLDRYANFTHMLTSTLPKHNRYNQPGQNRLGIQSDQEQPGLHEDYYVEVLNLLVPNGEQYYVNLNWEYRSKRYIQTDRALWKNKTVYYEASCFENTAAELNIKHLQHFPVPPKLPSGRCQPESDVNLYRARDLLHPGTDFAKTTAEKIAENLCKLGL